MRVKLFPPLGRPDSPRHRIESALGESLRHQRPPLRQHLRLLEHCQRRFLLLVWRISILPQYPLHRLHDPLDLLLPFGPLLRDHLPFAIEICLHGREAFRDGLRSVCAHREHSAKHFVRSHSAAHRLANPVIALLRYRFSSAPQVTLYRGWGGRSSGQCVPAAAWTSEYAAERDRGPDACRVRSPVVRADATDPRRQSCAPCRAHPSGAGRSTAQCRRTSSPGSRAAGHSSSR